MVKDCQEDLFGLMPLEEYFCYLKDRRDNKTDKLLYWAPQIIRGTSFEPLMLDYPELPEFRREECLLWTYGRACLGPLAFMSQFQWIFYGPAGVFTKTHVDPVGSAAWNATLSGRKRFVFLDPATEEAQRLTSDCHPFQASGVYPQFKENLVGQGHQEIIVEAGDIVYTPPLWPHYVENLAESVSVTENFLLPVHYPAFDASLARASRVTSLSFKDRASIVATRTFFKCARLMH